MCFIQMVDKPEFKDIVYTPHETRGENPWTSGFD